VRRTSDLCSLALVFFLLSTAALHAQADHPPSTAAVPSSSPSQPAATFQVSTRLVTVEVVARDHHGQSITGLTADDFQVFEQVGGKREQHPQKIAAFRAVSITELAAAEAGKKTMPAGVYSNWVTMQKVPVPPTVLLLDGLNTDRASQMQIHQQMIKMLASIPEDVPVAVFLLGHRLQMVQNFTTDPKLVRAALQKMPYTVSDEATHIEPQDDPDAMSAFVEDNSSFPPAALAAMQQFERETYALQMDMRVRETLEALRAIARHVAGYPGRKNLLWISSSFPIAIDPDVDLGFAGFRNYQDQMVEVVNALAEAKLAVYPVDPAGLQVSSVFQASTRLRGSASGAALQGRMDREDRSRFNRQDSMNVLAEQTGGIVCVNNNDLGECVKKAIADGSSFYEISYYPDSSGWHGEFHKVLVKTSRGGTHLAYRQGYYARTEDMADPKTAKQLQEAACNDLLTSTFVLMIAKELPAEPGKAKYYMAVDPTTLTFSLAGDGSRQLSLKVGICTFDKFGKPLQFFQQPFDQKLSGKEYASVLAHHGFPHIVVLPVTAETKSVRLLVKDVATGQLGSLNIPYSAIAASP
jgi:VWFA-related protein